MEWVSPAPQTGPATDFADACSPGSHLERPGGRTHSGVEARPGEMVAMVYFEGPVDFIQTG